MKATKKIYAIVMLLTISCVSQSMYGMKPMYSISENTQTNTIAVLNKIIGFPLLRSNLPELNKNINSLKDNYTFNNIYKLKKQLESIQQAMSLYAIINLAERSYVTSVLRYIINALAIQTIQIMLDTARRHMVDAKLPLITVNRVSSIIASLDLQGYSVDNLQKNLTVLNQVLQELRYIPSTQVPNIRQDMREPVIYAIQKISQILDNQFKLISDFIKIAKSKNIQISSLSKNEYNTSKLNIILGELEKSTWNLKDRTINAVLSALGKEPKAPSVIQQGQVKIKQEEKLQNIQSEALDKKQLQECCICMDKMGKPGNIPCPAALQSKAKQHSEFVCPECIQAVDACPICRTPLKK